MKQASHSKWPTASPLAAPVPARPTRCSLPIFEANRLAPTANHPTSRLARKKSALTFFSRRAAQYPIRSEERRVGKECRSRWWPDQEKKKEVLIANDDPCRDNLQIDTT